jgi:hypothetical protein
MNIIKLARQDIIEMARQAGGRHCRLRFPDARGADLTTIHTCTPPKEKNT